MVIGPDDGSGGRPSSRRSRSRRSRPARCPRRASRRCRAAAAPSAGRPSPQRIDLGQGKSATMRLTASASTSAARRARAARSPRTARRRAPRAGPASAPVLRRNPSSACGGARARALHFLAAASVASATSRAISTSRRGVECTSTAPVAEPRLAGAFGEQPRKVVARLRLHPRRDFLATEVRGGSRPSGGCAPSTPRTPPSRGRARGRYRPAARRREITPRACSVLKIGSP